MSFKSLLRILWALQVCSWSCSHVQTHKSPPQELFSCEVRKATLLLPVEHGDSCRSYCHDQGSPGSWSGGGLFGVFVSFFIFFPGFVLLLYCLLSVGSLLCLNANDQQLGWVYSFASEPDWYATALPKKWKVAPISWFLACFIILDDTCATE